MRYKRNDGGGGGGGGTVTSVSGANSIVSTPNLITGAGSLSLVNDALTPGNNKYYGTNGSGAKGFFSLPGAGLPSVSLVNYGTTTNVTVPVDLEIGLAGSGATTVNLPATGTVGDLIIVSDAGLNSGSNNITINAGTGNSIRAIISAQTYVIAINGEVVYLRLISNTAGVMVWKAQ